MGQNQRQLQETVPCRKQKESTKGEEQVTRRMSLNTRAHRSVSWSASDRQRNENFLWCCKQIVSSQKSVLKSHCALQKHTRSKEKITISKLKEQSIAELIQHTTFNWASMQTKSKGEFLKAGIPISKIDKLRSLLKKNGHRLTSSSNLGRYITLICKQEVERIKKELSLPGQEYMTRDVTMILNGSTRQGEAIAIIVRFIEDG